MITYLKHPRLSHPQFLAAWPGMGFVAFKTVSFLVEALGAERFAFLNPGDYFAASSVAVENNLARIPPPPESSFYYWKNPSAGGDLLFFLGDAQPTVEQQLRMAREVVRLAKSLSAFRVFTFAATPTAIQHKDNPGVLGVGNSASLWKLLRAHEIKPLAVGHISGLNGLLLGVASQEGLPGVCLLGEIPYYTLNLENPRAVRPLIRTLEKILSIRVDLSPLRRDIRKFDREIAQMGRKAQETMESFMSPEDEFGGGLGLEEEDPESGEDESPPLSDEARRRIEDLFRQARRDPSQAPVLKSELDRWGVYHLYEDRFLDLFRHGQNPPDN
jgi:proteasome assembly chaperone (PAC2) family protein